MSDKSDDLIYITPKDHDEWLELRKHSIGGSDAAIIVGENPYSSPYALWYDKVRTDTPEEKQSEAIRQGHDLEGYVADRFSELTGKESIILPETIKNPKFPFAHANIDRWIPSENCGLECKTTNSLNLSKFKNGEYPANYYIQCLHYMAILGCDKYYLAVLIFGKGFEVYEIERDEEMIADLMQAEKNFWYYVENNLAPPVDGTKATKQALAEQYSDVEDEEIQLDEFQDSAKTLLDLKRKQKEIKKEIDLQQQILVQAIGNSERATSGDCLITNKKIRKRQFDSKKFLEEHKEFDDDKYYKDIEYKVLKVTEESN